jgi:hypothetical protein
VKKIFFLIVATALLQKVSAQNEVTFPYLENVFQSSYINSAHVPEHKVSIGLPGISSTYIGLTNTGFSFNDLRNRTYFNAKNDKVDELAVGRTISGLKKENYFYSAANVDLFSIRVKVKHYFWSFNVTEKFYNRISMPQDFLRLLWRGNVDGAPQEGLVKYDLKNIAFNTTHYREYGIGMVRQERKFVFAGRLKYLQGLSNVYFKPKNLALTTEANMYDLSLTTDATVNTSGIPEDFDDFNARRYLTNMKNPGLGLDGAIAYKLDKKWTLSFAFNNVGFIKWNDNIKNHSVKGGTTFAGADLGPYILRTIKGDSLGLKDYLNQYGDTLQQAFKYRENSDKYSTWLIPQFYFTAKYNLFSRTAVAGSIYLEKFIALRPAFTLALYQEIGRAVNLVGTYSIQYGKFDNIGLGLVLKPHAVPLQFYFAGDHLLTTYTLVNDTYVAPLDSRTFNFRFGVNLVFGSIKTADKQTYVSK